MTGLSHALVPAQESKRWSFGRLLLLPVIQKGLFLGPKKARKLDTQIRASPVGVTGQHEVLIFFRPTPSWLPPSRSTCFQACCI